MAQGVTFDLVWAALWVGLLGLWVSSRDLPFPVALCVAGVKIAIPFVYFGWFYDGSWTFLDDITYQAQGTEMLQLGYTPITALVNPEGIQHLISLSGGFHIAYGWWNLLGQYFFGEYYFSPVFLNVGLTFISGSFFLRIIYMLGFNTRYAQFLLVFFLLHFDVLLWSSLINFKDVIVLNLSIMSFYIFICLNKKFSIFHIFVLLCITFIFFWLRFYIPFIMIFSVLFWFCEESEILRNVIKHKLIISRKSFFILLIILFSAISITHYLGLNRFLSYIKSFSVQPFVLIYGFIRMYLTPRPWSIDSSYSFLLIPSIMHLVLTLPSIYGGWLLWKRSKEARLVIIYLLAVLLLYGAYSEIQGIRQRFQVVWIIAWMQFHFLWIIIQGAVGYTKSPRSSQLLPMVKRQ